MGERFVGVLNILGGEPGVAEAVLSRDALGGVLMKHARNQILGRLRHAIPVCGVEGKLLLDDVAEDLFVVVAFEGRVAAQEDEEDDAEGPHIALLVVVTLEHLGGDVVGSADHGVHSLDFGLL
eukprot:CAMPEP_0185583886 /NCGR_PEP_ID=MMETSP0434-20130131/28483_1 /TAXON_ID=626734 ORGANISM="Favella taraikaensis, Strain Fe Narragansett Bay" /NCGR_SAMPLE_ID=MMETSP0434 /ASSEMBLY_ACC=CAM_ASM_000379 /LENGTH=122 /DNA_ID=CAMNT_0028203289 /DNA_START=738 /DNA_END=1106 /DNA_ORIENTATION=-